MIAARPRRAAPAAVVLMLVAAMSTLAGPAGARPAPVTCGTTILSSTTLTADVGPCPGTGLRIGADDVTLDLGGFRVVGDGLAEGPLGAPGILGSGRNRVTVRNGVVTGFDSGIYFEQSTNVAVTGVNVHDNVGGLHGEFILGEGIQFYQVLDSRIAANQVVHNGTFSGINLYDTSGTVVERNNVLNNNIVQTDPAHGGPRSMQDIGIWVVLLELPTTGNVVRNNIVANNGLDGIQVARGANGNRVVQNAVSGNGFGQVPGLRRGDGITVLSNINQVVANQSLRNAANGIHVVRSVNADTGLPNGGQANTIRSNIALGNARAGPFPAFDLHDTNRDPPCDNNTWGANVEVTRNQPCVN